MADYDGSIRIDTKINTDNASSQLLQLQNRIVKTADKIDAIKSRMKELGTTDIPTNEYTELQKELTKATKEMDKFASKAKTAETIDIPTERYNQISSYLEAANRKFDRMLERQEKLRAAGSKGWDSWALQTGLEKTGEAIRIAENDLKELIASGKAFTSTTVSPKGFQEASAKVADLQRQMQDLKDTGKAFTLGSGSDEYQKLSRDLQYAQADMRVLGKRHDELVNKQKKVGKEGKKAFSGMNAQVKKTGGMFKTLLSRFKGIALSLLVFNWISKGFNALVNGMKEGFKNLVQYSDSYNQKVSKLTAANTQLKNSLATAFQPLIEMVIPYLIDFIGYLTTAANKVTQLAAAMAGKSTWTKAVEVQEDYAASLDGSADSAKKAEKAVEGYLSPLDEINKFTPKQEESSPAGTSPKDMFTEVAIDDSTLNFIDQMKEKLRPVVAYAQELAGVFGNGFLAGLGDAAPRIDKIKESAQSISDSLVDIFTDKEVTKAADGFFRSLVYMLGSYVGSYLSIGLSIATNLVSGIARYLDENKERIKGHLISMFDIWEAINILLAEGMQAVAYILESLASENAIRLTSNLIGIVSEIFMGVQEVAWKLTRDLLNVILQPIIENKEKFKQAFEGLLGVLADIAGTIEDAIADTFAKINQVYDEHLKPFFDSVADGVSEITGAFLDFFNGKLLPVLQNIAAEFDVLWKEHIQPMIDKAIELFGKLFDYLKVRWENELKPIIMWIVDNILPLLIPVIEGIWQTVKTVVETITGAIGGVIDVFGGLIDFLTGVFSGDWEKAWEGIKDIFKGIWNTIASIVEGVLNLIIDGMNTLSIDVPPEVPLIGGLKFGFDIPHIDIPRLAQGTVVPAANGEFLAMLGDNRREPEIVSPISAIEKAVGNVLGQANFGGGQDQHLHVYLDGYQVYESVLRHGQTNRLATGSNPFALGGI